MPTQLSPEALSHLAEAGYCVLPHYIQPALCQSLKQEAESRFFDREFRSASIGREQLKQQNPTVRRDKILWMEGTTSAQNEYFEVMDKLRIQINRTLFLGLKRIEAHFSCYEAGDFYATHKDSFPGRRNRMLSSVLYLNQDWTVKDLGQLEILTADQQKVCCSVLPESGTLVLFLSEEIWHRVQPAGRLRISIAGWYRIDE